MARTRSILQAVRNFLNSFIDRHESCIGIRLFKSRKTFCQLWYCAPRYRIKPHSHDKQNIELYFVFGSAKFTRIIDGKQQSYYVRPSKIGKHFSIRAGVVHWFEVSTWPLLFINIAKATEGNESVSAAKDFVEVDESIPEKDLFGRNIPIEFRKQKDY